MFEKSMNVGSHWLLLIGIAFTFHFVHAVHASSPAASPATVTVTRQAIKTYPFSDPDPVPILVRKGGDAPESPIYPYFFYDGYSKEGIDREWTVVKLENSWIEVFILPEVGGKVWGAREKSTGREFIYHNKVLKFRQIGLRGPWTSGGIEFNFGVIGHAPTCATPVDWLTRTDPDGTATCVVGALDLPSRTRWSVTIALAPDKAYFETRAFWHNPTPLHQSYYNWQNAAVRVGDDLQYSFPGDRWIGHNFDEPARPWPIDHGRDLSWYKNNDFGSYHSYFTFGERKDFYGLYWHDARFGSGHWAPAEDMPGRKVWIWGLSREGMIWENLLTDADGQYSEPQAGRYLNQSDTAFFQPGASDSWREIWFPCKETGTIVAASPLGVLGLTTSTEVTTVSFCALQDVDEELIIWGYHEPIRSERLRLKPLQVYHKALSVDWNLFYSKICSIEVGGTRLQWSKSTRDFTSQRPTRFHVYETDTAEGMYLQAERLEKGRKFAQALALYEKCLAHEPRHVRALCRAAELRLRRAEIAQAETFANRALEIDMYDPQANFIYGLIAREKGVEWQVAARDAFGWAARSLEYRSAAWAQLAEMCIQDTQTSEARAPLEQAVEYARRALEANATNITARLDLAVAFRLQHRNDEARAELEKIQACDPLDPYARFERWLLDETAANLKAFQSPIANELPEQTYIEMAAYYDHKLGLDPEAKKLIELAPETAESVYWRAYLAPSIMNSNFMEEVERSKKLLVQAETLSPRGVFPYRPEAIPVFSGAMRVSPEDWKPKYYLGLIYLGLGRTAEARELFNQCGEPDFAPFYLLQGRIAQKENPARALDLYEKALKTDRKEWRAWHAVVAQQLAMSHAGTLPTSTLSLAREAAEAFPQSDELRLDLVKALIANNQDGEALNVLNHSSFLPFEGASEVHEIYVACLLQLGAGRLRAGDYAVALKYFEHAREFPETLGSGRPYEPDLRAQDYLSALCLDKMGRADEAWRALKSAADYTLAHKGGKWRHFGALALKRTGKEARAKEILEKNKQSKEVQDLLRGIE